MWSVNDWFLGALIILAPLGTRYVFQWGGIADAPSEYGTISLWVTQLLVLAYVGTVFSSSEHRQKLSDLRHDPVTIALGVFVVICYLSAFLSSNQLDACQHASWLALAAIIIIAVRIHRPSRIVCLSSLVIGGIIQSVFIFWQTATQQVAAAKWLGMAAHLPTELGVSVVVTGATRWLRGYGTFSHPNIAGCYLALALVASLALYPQLDRRGRPLIVIASAILTLALSLTFSRGAWIAAFGGIVTITILPIIQTHRRLVSKLPLTIIALTTIIFSIFAWPLLHTRVVANGRLEQQSLNERAQYATDAWQLFQLHPLLGVGPGQMPIIVHDQLDRTRDGWSYQPAHNIALVAISETGIIGLSALLLMASSLIIQTWRRGQSADPAAPHIVAVLVIIISAGSVDHFLWSFWPGVLIAALALGSVVNSAPINQKSPTSGKLE